MNKMLQIFFAVLKEKPDISSPYNTVVMINGEKITSIQAFYLGERAIHKLETIDVNEFLHSKEEIYIEYIDFFADEALLIKETFQPWSWEAKINEYTDQLWNSAIRRVD